MNVQFTDRARKILKLAYREARLRHEHVDSGHLLLGLIQEGGGVAAHVLRGLGVNFADVRREVENLLFAAERGTAAVDKLSYPPAVKKVLRYSLEEARSLNHNYVGSEHLLLGMLRDRGGIAAQALSKVGVELTAARAAIVQLLGAPHSVEKCPRPLPSHISVGLLGRAFFGLCAFLSSLAFGAFAADLVVWLVMVGPPALLWKAVLVHLVIDVFTVASIFMLLLAISFWAGGSRWTDRLLTKMMRKGVVAVGVILTALFAGIGVMGIADPVLGVLGLFLAFLAFILMVAVPIVGLIRPGSDTWWNQ
jgi:hypothetical protein